MDDNVMVRESLEQQDAFFSATPKEVSLFIFVNSIIRFFDPRKTLYMSQVLVFGGLLLQTKHQTWFEDVMFSRHRSVGKMFQIVSIADS